MHPDLVHDDKGAATATNLPLPYNNIVPVNISPEPLLPDQLIIDNRY